jgi:hypothetical protein
MGLMIHSLGELPANAKRSYYVYLLDFGWHEPLGQALEQNFGQMADSASKSDAVVIKGTPGSHFADEVLSWHGVNGIPAAEILPAILITSRHPDTFRRQGSDHDRYSHPLVLIPLRESCSSTSDVAALIGRIFRDIQEGTELSEFAVAKEQQRRRDGTLADALILKPACKGVGVDLKELKKFLGKRIERL